MKLKGWRALLRAKSERREVENSNEISVEETKEKALSIRGYPESLDRENSALEISVVNDLVRRVSSTENRIDCSFFKVPEPIRRVRSVCYNPQLISFGLYESGMRNEQCATMEEVKREVASSVLKVLLNSTDVSKRGVHSGESENERKIEVLWEHLRNQVVPAGEGDEIRKQYSDAPQAFTVDVQDQLVLDAMFLVSFMLFQHANPQTKSFGLTGFEQYETLLHIFTSTAIFCNINIINSDIWLFENQIPLFLIRRMVREMYIYEGKDRRTAEEKKAAAEEAFVILVRKTFQKVLRVLPGNYRTNSGQKSEMSVTDKMLESTSLKKRSHLLECLYRLVVDEKLEERSEYKNVNDTDSLDKHHSLTAEEIKHKNFRKWSRVMRSPVSDFMKRRKGKLTKDGVQEERRTTEMGRFVSRGHKRRINGKEPHTQHRQQPSISESSESEISVRSISSVIEPGMTEEDYKPKSPELRKNINERHQNEFEYAAENEPADVPHDVILQSPPRQEVERGYVGMRAGSPARYQKSRLSEEQRAASSVAQIDQGLDRRKWKRTSQRYLKTASEVDRVTTLSQPGQGSSIAEASELKEERNRILCLPNRFVTRARGAETAIDIDSNTLPTVAVLREVGIRVKGTSVPGCHCKVELTNSHLPLGSATLHISPLHVDGIAERLLRNLVVYEMVSASEHKLITYLQCLDDLINTDKDVILLKEGRHPVILNSSLDERDVAKLFNELLEGCTVYYNPKLDAIRKEVRSYYLQQWRRPLTEFKERYCNESKPWLAISLLAGFVLLSLAALQTAYTVMSYYSKK